MIREFFGFCEIRVRISTLGFLGVIPLLASIGIIAASNPKLILASFPFVLAGFLGAYKSPQWFFVIFLLALSLTGFLDPLLSVKGGSLILPFIFSGFIGLLFKESRHAEETTFFLPLTMWFFLVFSLLSVILGLFSYRDSIWKPNEVVAGLPWGDIPLKNAIGWAVLSLLKLLAGLGIFIFTLKKFSENFKNSSTRFLFGALLISSFVGVAHYLGWITVGSFHTEYVRSETLQYNATFSHPNSLGLFTALCFVYWLGVVSAKKSPKIYYLMIVPLATLIILSGSRSALLVAAISFFLFIIYLAVTKKIKILLFLGALVVGLSASISVHQISENFRHIKFIKEIVKGEGEAHPFKKIIDDRKDIWKLGWNTFIKNPMFGVGRGLYLIKMPSHQAKNEDALNDNSGNMYLHVLAEQGVVGFIPFIGMFLSIGFMCLRAGFRKMKEVNFVALSVLLSMGVSFFVGATLLDLHVSLIFWFLLALPLADQNKLFWSSKGHE